MLSPPLQRLGPLVGQSTDSTPLTGRGDLFSEDVARQAPWQFRNVVVREAPAAGSG
jgi:homospermidine synthase